MDAIAEQLLARLRSDPRDRDAYDALRAHLVHGHDLAALADLLESWALAHPDDRQGSSDAWTDAADAVLQSGGDRSRAKILYRRALELNVLHPRAGDRLRELLETDTDFQGLIEVLEPYARALEAAGGAPNYIAGLYQRLAELWEHAFNRPDLAASYRERATVLRARPSQPIPAVVSEDPGELAQALSRRAEAESTPARRASLLCELARIRETQLGDVEGALEALRQARSLSPTDVLIMHQLATTLLKHAPRGDAQAARTAQRRASELFYQIAQAVEPSQALPYVESALAAAPDHEGALALLERVAPEQGRPDLLPGYWVRFLAAAGDGPESDQRRVWLGRAYLRSDQLEDAIYCLQPAAEHHFEGAAELLQRAYERLGSGQVFAPGEADSEPPPTPPQTAPEAPPAPSGITELRKAVRNALAGRRSDEAAEHCRSILAIDPSDGEAFNLLESHLRKRGDYAALQALLLASTRVPSLALDARRARLREAALLSEAKLKDPEAALDAWRQVVQLDPGDRDAAVSLKRLLQRAHGWDELAALVERDAFATPDPEEKIGRLRELLVLHRDKRKDLAQAAEALRRLHALVPDDAGVRAELCELLLALEHWSEAVPVLRECIANAQGEQGELRYSHALARILHERLHALDEAYQTCAKILEFKPSDQTAFERMERIDVESGNNVRLLTTLERRALLATKSERPTLLLHMARIAEEQLHDLERAAGYLGEALDLAPENEAALERMTDMFERAGRFERLLQLLEERSQLDIQPRTRAAVLRRMGRISSERLEDAAAAADTYRKLLQLEEDEHALRFLRDYARARGSLHEEADLLRRLAHCTRDPAQRRDLLLERAHVLHERLGALSDAIATLRQILEEIDPTCEAAIELLATLSVRDRDPRGLALALERRVDRSSELTLRLPLLKRLAEVYEVELTDAARAAGTLQRWTREDPSDPEPHRRLRRLLAPLERWSELVATLDALSEREPERELREQAVIEAAQIACDRLDDVQGGWRRLLPLIGERHPVAVQLLHDIAERHGLKAELAALYVRLAQESENPAHQAQHWRAAADTFEHELDDRAQAFEASLRLLAADLTDPVSLARVDRLALETQSFRRLAQVYDRLLKSHSGEAAQLDLLRRIAQLLEAEQPDDALDRVLQACGLAPLDDELLGRAEALAQRTHRAEDLLPLYERRCDRSSDDAAKLEMLLRAARLCDATLQDREQALIYLRKAVDISVASGAAGHVDVIESVARELDATRPETGKDSVRRALVQLYREAAARAQADLAERLLLRAAELLQHELGDERGAFDMLVHGAGFAPRSERLYATVRAMANTRGRLDAIDAQLARMLEDATDLLTTVVVLRRRGTLLEDGLGRHHDAASVYSKLSQLVPDDALAAEHLRANLRRSGRHQELLSALNRQLERTSEPAQRVTLMKEIATAWELDLKNRWEALDAWKAVLALSPDDADANAGVARASRPHHGTSERSGGSRTEDTVSFGLNEEAPRREIFITDRPAPPSSVRRTPAPSAESPPEPLATDPVEAATDGTTFTRGQANAPASAADEVPDDLAALDAAVGARIPEVEELDDFASDPDPDLDLGESLPMPLSASRTRASTPDRGTPPPLPAPSKAAAAPAGRTPPPLPTPASGKAAPSPATPPPPARPAPAKGKGKSKGRRPRSVND